MLLVSSEPIGREYGELLCCMLAWLSLAFDQNGTETGIVKRRRVSVFWRSVKHLEVIM